MFVFSHSILLYLDKHFDIKTLCGFKDQWNGINFENIDLEIQTQAVFFLGQIVVF